MKIGFLQNKNLFTVFIVTSSLILLRLSDQSDAPFSALKI